MKTPFYLMLFKTQHAQTKKNRETMDEYHLSPGQPKVLRYLNAHQDCKLRILRMNVILKVLLLVR